MELVPLARRDGAGEGAPQDAVLGEDVHDLAVEADPGRWPASGELTWITWLPRVMIPAELASRLTSTELVAASAPGQDLPVAVLQAGRQQCAAWSS